MPDLLIAHSSDLHIDGRSSETFHPLCRVLATAKRAQAHVLLLAGDIFDHNRLPLAILDRTARLLDEAGLPVIILPGNHDCLTPDSVYRRGGIGDVPNVHVLGVTDDECVLLPQHELEVWGRAHYDYKNMSPLRDPRPRAARRRIAMAHGHWLQSADERHRGWLITNDDISATQADYVALGHWPQAAAAGPGDVPAYYSGAPDLAKTLNLVRLDGAGRAQVTRVPLDAAV